VTIQAGGHTSAGVGILNCPNGYINLRTCTFTPRVGPGRPLFRMSVDYAFVPTAMCPLWLRYLNEAHPGDGQRAPGDQVIPYLQLLAGTALIGRVPPLRSGFWIHGQSMTGKSAFANIMRRVCDSYATLLYVTLLMRSGSERRSGRSRKRATPAWGRPLAIR